MSNLFAPDDDDDEDGEAPILVSSADEGFSEKVPVTILTGFLGSGKTTLLSYILTENHGKKIAVIENEFSSGLGIEGMIAKSGVDGSNIDSFFELSNGCICCTVKDNLLSTLEQLVLHRDRFDYILIETTGVANPGPIISTFWVDAGLDSALKLDGVVCVVDSLNILNYLDSPDVSSDVQMQISYADRILLNKADLVSTEHMDTVNAQVSQYNGMAEVKRTSFSNVEIGWVLDIDSYNSDRFPGFPSPSIDEGLGVKYMTETTYCSPCAPAPALQGAHCVDTLTTEALLFSGYLQLVDLQRMLDGLLYMKGNSEVLHNTYAGQSQSASDGGLFAAEGVDVSGQVAPEVHLSPSPIIYRMKGILYIHGAEKLHILQAVNDIFDIQPSSFSPGDSEDTSGGLNKIVVIGRNLDKAAILELFKACCVSEAAPDPV